MSVFAQTRQEVKIFLAPVVSDVSEHAAFLVENFSKEIAGAGYGLTGDPAKANYTLALEVRPNIILYDDGAEEPAPSGEKQFSLQINFLRNADNIEVVSFSFLFTELEEMYNHTSYMLHDLTANIPFSEPSGQVRVVQERVEVVKEIEVIKEVLLDEPDSWRRKWLYFRLSADFPLNYYKVKSDGLYEGKYIYSGNMSQPYDKSRLNDKILIMPGFTVGMELQFFNWISLELDYEMMFEDAIDYAIMPGIGAQLKFPIKPGRYFMIEPYFSASYTWNLADHSLSFPPFAVGGGLQFGVKSGRNGAWFLDVNALYPLKEVRTKNKINKNYPNPSELHWNRYILSLGIGYKIGFINRKQM